MKSKMKSAFKFPMTRAERITGCIYIPVHAVLLPFAVAAVCTWASGGTMSGAYINLVYYAISFIFVLAAMFKYLRASFSDLFDNLIGSLQSVLLGYVLYYAAMYVLTIAILFLRGSAINPNTQAVMEQTKLNTNVMIVVGVLLAPVVEEALFRGALFGSIRQKSRILAYVVSALLFAVYHLWQFFYVDGFSWTLALYLLQYLPASVALAWCYERSGSIWAPIALHSAINLISLSVQITL